MRPGLGGNACVVKCKPAACLGGQRPLATSMLKRQPQDRWAGPDRLSVPPEPPLGGCFLRLRTQTAEAPTPCNSTKKRQGLVEDSSSLLVPVRSGTRSAAGSWPHTCLCQFVWPGSAFLPDLNKDVCFVMGRPARGPGTCPVGLPPSSAHPRTELSLGRVVDPQVFFSGREAGLGVHSGSPHGLKRLSLYTVLGLVPGGPPSSGGPRFPPHPLASGFS